LSRKVIHVAAEASPNVRRAFVEMGVASWQEYLDKRKAGTLRREPSGATLLPGVLSWAQYSHRRETWDAQEQAVGLDATFYQGRQLMLWPPDVLALSLRLALEMESSGRFRRAKGGGIDSAEGGDNTSLCAVDELGVVELVSLKTADTTRVVVEAVDFMRRHQLSPDRVCFDLGGGGKQHMDRLRKMGYDVRGVRFGAAVEKQLKRGHTMFAEKKEVQEDQYVYRSRRAEMYYEGADLFVRREGIGGKVEGGFAVPFHKGGPYASLKIQLSKVPRLKDDEGRMIMLGKGQLTEQDQKAGRTKTLIQLIGHSPDEMDALVLAIHAMLHKVFQQKAGSGAG